MLEASAGFAAALALFDGVAALAGSGALAADAVVLAAASLFGVVADPSPPGAAHEDPVELSSNTSATAMRFDLSAKFAGISFS